MLNNDLGHNSITARDSSSSWSRCLAASPISGAAGRDHPTVTASGHFVEDDQPLRFAEIIRRFVSVEVEAGSGGA